MTYLRIHREFTGRWRWRQRAVIRRRSLLVHLSSRYACSPTAHAKEVPASDLLSSELTHSVLTTLRIGDFVVGHEGDPQLLGHPGIRY